MSYAQTPINRHNLGPGLESHNVTWALAGLGRSYLMQPPGSPTDWNRLSSRGSKAGVSAWSTKSGGKYSGAADPKLAADVYRFQHDVQNCQGSKDPYDRNGPDCINRDGRIGQKTACLIANAIRGNTTWGQHWLRNLHFEANFGKAGSCQMNCSDVACTYKVAAGCAPCNRPGPGPGPTPPDGGSNLPMILGGLALVGGLGWCVMKGKKGGKRKKRRRR